MLQIERTIIEYATNELRTIQGFAGHTAFSPSDVDELVSAFRACSAYAMLALDGASGMTDEAVAELQAIERECSQTFVGIDTHQDRFDPRVAAFAAIRFSLCEQVGQAFLQSWIDGEFDEIRSKWPQAPESIYVGIDYFHYQR